MFAVLVTTAFTEEFRMTLVFGVPFLGLLVMSFCFLRRPAPPGRVPRAPFFLRLRTTRRGLLQSLPGSTVVPLPDRPGPRRSPEAG